VMTTQIYLIMYVLMFVAAVRLRRTQPDHARGYRARGLVTWCWIGGLASVAAFLIGFVPPSQFGHSSVVLYALLTLLGIVLTGVLPPFLLYRFRQPEWQTGDTPGQAVSATGAAAAASTNGAVSGHGAPHRPWAWAIAAGLVVLAVVLVPVFKQQKSTH